MSGCSLGKLRRANSPKNCLAAVSKASAACSGVSYRPRSILLHVASLARSREGDATRCDGTNGGDQRRKRLDARSCVWKLRLRGLKKAAAAGLASRTDTPCLNRATSTRSAPWSVLRQRGSPCFAAAFVNKLPAAELLSPAQRPSVTSPLEAHPFIPTVGRASPFMSGLRCSPGCASLRDGRVQLVRCAVSPAVTPLIRPWRTAAAVVKWVGAGVALFVGIASALRKWGLPWTRFPALSAVPAPVPPPVGLLTVPIRAPARSASAPRRTRSRARTPRCRSGVWPGLTRRPRWNSYSPPIRRPSPWACG